MESRKYSHRNNEIAEIEKQGIIISNCLESYYGTCTNGTVKYSGSKENAESDSSLSVN